MKSIKVRSLPLCLQCLYIASALLNRHGSVQRTNDIPAGGGMRMSPRSSTVRLLTKCLPNQSTSSLTQYISSSFRYFLITPKLLPDLYFAPQVTVLCVFNGPWMIPQKGSDAPHISILLLTSLHRLGYRSIFGECKRKEQVIHSHNNTKQTWAEAAAHPKANALPVQHNCGYSHLCLFLYLHSNTSRRARLITMLCTLSKVPTWLP